MAFVQGPIVNRRQLLRLPLAIGAALAPAAISGACDNDYVDLEAGACRGGATPRGTLRHGGSLGMVAVHSALLPNGLVLNFGYYDWPQHDDVQRGRYQLWDPTTRRPIGQPNEIRGWNPFCAGHSFLGDGRLLVAGGHDTASPIDASSADQIRLVRAVNGGCVWENLGNDNKMEDNRWYPTCVTLANGDSLIIGGSSPFGTDDFAAMNEDYEYFDVSENRLVRHRETRKNLPRDQESYPPNDSRRKEAGGTRLAGLYPLTHLMPRGPYSSAPVFVVTESFARIYNTDTSQILRPKVDLGGFRTWPTQGSSVLMPITISPDGEPPSEVTVLIVGGGETGRARTDHSALRTANHYTYNVREQELRATGTVNLGRRRFMGDCHLLPDGNLALIGGAEQGYASDNGPRVTMIELIEPRTFVATDMVDAGIRRGYHATSLLLPDGSIYIAGGTGGWPVFANEHSFEINGGRIGDPGGLVQEFFEVSVFEPPYFGGGRRPVIVKAPREISAGERFEVRSQSQDVRDIVVLTRHSSRTHSLDTDQRHLRLFARRRLEENGEVVLSVRLPDDPSWAPPGPYLLWLLRGCGKEMGGGHVPSLGWRIDIKIT